MDKDDILQLVIETGDELYNKNHLQSETYAKILSDIEILIAEVLYKMQQNI